MPKVPQVRPEEIPQHGVDQSLLVSELEVRLSSTASSLVVDVGYLPAAMPRTKHLYLVLTPAAAARLARDLEANVQQHLYGDGPATIRTE